VIDPVSTPEFREHHFGDDGCCVYCGCVRRDAALLACMSQQEAEEAYRNAPEATLSPERIDELVKKIMEQSQTKRQVTLDRGWPLALYDALDGLAKATEDTLRTHAKEADCCSATRRNLDHAKWVLRQVREQLGSS
jgi:hypothetical protein